MTSLRTSAWEARAVGDKSGKYHVISFTEFSTHLIGFENIVFSLIG